MKFPPIPNATSAFAAVTDTGTNIQATLAAARASFGANYIEVFKSLAAEGWRWRFSDDVGNYLDSSSTAAKAAFPALAGANYSAFALKVSPANGIATGRQVHVNGVADTITDGLGNVRKMIILKNEATGTWYVYHPDLTAGRLLYLEQTTGETVDATIGTILSNSFVAAAALPSGTYLWVAFAEVSGFLKLTLHTGNGVADGPLANCGLSPIFSFTKRCDSPQSYVVQDAIRPGYNPTNASLYFDLSGAEQNTESVDLVSNGVKFRDTVANNNASTGKYVGMTIGQPFRYANAR